MSNEPSMKHNRHSYMYIKCHVIEIFWLLVPSLAVLAFNLVRGTFVDIGPDAKLYLSIADNFISTGHFIQTARPIEKFVVPFGVPLILTVFRAVRLSVEAIIAVQHFMLGLTCMLLYKTEHVLFGKGGFASLFFCVAMLRTRLNPNNIYLEHYFLLLLAVLLYLSVQTEMPDKKRLTLMNAAGVYMVACRAVLAPVYIAVLVYSFVVFLRRRISAGRFAAFLLIPVVLFGCNTLVNYRETGYPIVMDSYSGDGFYCANNPNASTGYYSRSIFDTIGDAYYAVKDDPNLDFVEKNERLKEMGKEWVLENPGKFLTNTVQKFREDFIWIWRYTLIPCFLGAMHMIATEQKRRKWVILTLAINLIVAVITSMGLVVPRYTVVVWPLAALHLSAITHPTLKRLKERFSRKRKINA